MAKIKIKQGEAKTITFTVTEDGSAVDLSAAQFNFQVKDDKADTAMIDITTGAFGMTNAASGIINCPISSTDSDQIPGTYYGELKITFSASNIDKSNDIDFIIEDAVH